MMRPKVIICDEPVSSLDVSVQAQILNLLEDIKERFGLSMVFVAHDVSVVKNISDRVLVMYLGKICEVLPSHDLQDVALHPYTRMLLTSIPGAEAVVGQAPPMRSTELPSPVNPPTGCRFRTRCPLATDRCAAEEPLLRAAGDGHYVACHNVVVPAETHPTTETKTEPM